MLYMAYRGWFVANVPLMPGILPPDGLLAVPSDRVFCLVMSPERLQHLRRTRAERDGIPVHPYASMEQIRSELTPEQLKPFEELLKHPPRRPSPGTNTPPGFSPPPAPPTAPGA